MATKATGGRDYCALSRKYTEQVVSGKILACKWVKAACQRQIDDLDRWKKAGPYKWDASAANKVCAFIELMPHVKGPLSNTPIVLEPWQCFILTTIFGWVKRDTGTRRFRKAYVEVPRGNAKSTLSSGIGLYMGFVEGEGGARVYSAATTMKQAKEVFGDAQAMARKSHAFRNRFGVEVFSHNIHQVSTNSFFEAVSSEENTLDGLNIHLAIVDELHAHRTRGVHDVLETGAGKRPQSLLWEITTAGFNRSGICYEVRSYVTQILNSVLKRHDGMGYAVTGNAVDEETYFGIVYTIDDDDDVSSVEALQKANPNWGISVEIDSVMATQRKAMQMASAANNFKTKHLNLWVNADTAWMSMVAWDACHDPHLNLNDLEGEPCYIGVDLATKIDVAAKLRIFPPNGSREFWAIAGSYYLPEAAVEQGVNTNAAHYAGWAIEGKMTLTPGEVTDFDFIKDDLLEDLRRFDVREVGLDPFQALTLTNSLEKAGADLNRFVEVGATVKNFSEPMKQLEAMVLSKQIRHNDPVLTWMISNVVAHMDVKENIYPRKERPENKIDGAVALIMALSRAMVGAQPGSYIEHRGGVLEVG